MRGKTTDIGERLCLTRSGKHLISITSRSNWAC